MVLKRLLFSLAAATGLLTPLSAQETSDTPLSDCRITHLDDRYPDVRITIDAPRKMHKNRPTKVIFYALPNGNTIEWTAGKRMEQTKAFGRRKEHTIYDPEYQRITLHFFIRICRERVRDWQCSIYQQHDMQKIQMALMLAAQQFQQNRAQRIGGNLFVQKARDHLVNGRPDK